MLFAAAGNRSRGSFFLHEPCTFRPSRPGQGAHGQKELLRQRIFAIAMGYEDTNDHQSLRFDPGLRTGAGSLPETSPALASQSTISRFENRVATVNFAA